MLSGTKQYLRDAWWIAVFPGLAISIVVLGVNTPGGGRRLREPAAAARDTAPPQPVSDRCCKGIRGA